MWYRYAKAKYSDEKHSSVIVALFLPEEAAKKLVLDPDNLKDGDVEREESLHITIAHLGKAEELENLKETIMSTMRAFASRFEPIDGRVSGVGRFNSESETEPFYASCDVPHLNSIREQLVDELESKGVKISKDHGFTPHITLVYLPKKNRSPKKNVKSFDVSFGCISIAWAGDRTDFEFTPNSD